MKNQFIKFLCLGFLFIACKLSAQEPGLQYIRSWDKQGINVFEPSKSEDQPAFSGLKLKLGASFTQDYQHLEHSNTPTFAIDFQDQLSPAVNKNLLYGATSQDSTSATLAGFNTAMANLYLDVQLADGIRMCVESYMSTRHHNEFWVKGGYIQVDRLPMFGNPDWFKKYVRLKVGHFQPNYGDMQFRRTDAGNTFFNPFVENYILDAFTTEIGGEVYVFPIKGLMLMGGLTGGTLEGNIDVAEAKPAPFTFDKTERHPSIFGKVAYDSKLDNLRYRLALSFYKNDASPNNTLYYGDRGGSHYFMVMEPNRSEIRIEGKSQGIGQSTYSNNKDSGRFIPVFNSEVSSVMLNAFIKYKGIEFFGTYETAEGRVELPVFLPKDNTRKVSQFAAELIYRFFKDEQCYLGVRYNQMSGTPFGIPPVTTDITIDRIAIAAGWFPLNNMMIKAEYVMQKYKDFAINDYRNNGEFSGLVLEASVAF
jgi:hypothetical protein